MTVCAWEAFTLYEGGDSRHGTYPYPYHLRSPGRAGPLPPGPPGILALSPHIGPEVHKGHSIYMYVTLTRIL
jgi:hypothetical protein